MALFTGKGDDGTTYAFGCNQRFSKSSIIAEALGDLDEANSFIGLCKVKSIDLKTNKKSFEEILSEVQQNLFIIQAEVAGAEKTIEEKKIKEMEELINSIEKEMPEIKTFFLPGGAEVSVMLDVARTKTRRAERRVVAAKEEGKIKIKEFSLAYLNRLSSLLYAMTRLTNHLSGIKEEPPTYK